MYRGSDHTGDKEQYGAYIQTGTQTNEHTEVYYRSFRVKNFLGTKAFISEDIWAWQCDCASRVSLYAADLWLVKERLLPDECAVSLSPNRGG